MDAPVFEESYDLGLWTPLVVGEDAINSSAPPDIAGLMYRVQWRVPAAGRAR